MRGNSTSRRNAAWRRAGFVPIDGSPPSRAALAAAAGRAERASGAATRARRAGLAVGAALGAGLAYLAVTEIGFGDVVHAIVRSDLNWVLAATALMVASMFLRAESWLAIARSRAAPSVPLRRRDVTSATMIGVLMSATLPARLGEPARAMVLARHTGSVRETLPVLLGRWSRRPS